MTAVFEVEVTDAARTAFPGASALAVQHEKVAETVDVLDWSVSQSVWSYVGKEELLAHPAVRPFCDYYSQVDINPRKNPPSVANFIYRAFCRDNARIPKVNSIVDVVNWVAVSTMTSIGAFDTRSISGAIQLDVSRDGDCYKPVGGDSSESIPAGRLVLRDREKILSLFSIRDSSHTAIRAETDNLLLLGCVLPGINPLQVRAALDLLHRKLASGLDCPDLHVAPKGPWYGRYGGSYIAETLSPPIAELSERYLGIITSKSFQRRYQSLLKHYVGRQTPLTLAENLSKRIGVKTYLKREDLAHTGAHKINNALGQALLAQVMGKRRVIAETGAGQHGVATAAACALLGIECVIYMGLRDMERQALNVHRMRLMGATVVAAEGGSQTLKDAINDALRDWVANADTTYYLLGSALGPHPYPAIVRHFQSVIGDEAKQQFASVENGDLPDAVVACVGGGSNAIGLFSAFIDNSGVVLCGVEAAGKGEASGHHSIRFGESGQSRLGVLQGCQSYVLQNEHGQILETHSVAPGLDYAMVGPEHSQLRDEARAQYLDATDEEALEALKLLSRCEGIIPALESAHAVAGAVKLAKTLPKTARIIINISGRGDKDMETITRVVAETGMQEVANEPN